MLVAVVLALVIAATIAAFLVYRRRYAKEQVVFSTKVRSAPVHPLETVAGATISVDATDAARNVRFVDLDPGFRKAPVGGIERLTVDSIQSAVRQNLEMAIARRQRFAAAAAAAAAAARARAGFQQENGGTAIGIDTVDTGVRVGSGPPSEAIYEDPAYLRRNNY